MRSIWPVAADEQRGGCSRRRSEGSCRPPPASAPQRIGEWERASEWSRSRNSFSAGLTMSLCWCWRFVWWPSCLSIPRAGFWSCKMNRPRPKRSPAAEGRAGRSPKPRSTKRRKLFATTGQVCVLLLVWDAEHQDIWPTSGLRLGRLGLEGVPGRVGSLFCKQINCSFSKV